MSTRTHDERRAGSFRVSSVLLLVAIVPLVGLGVLTFATIREAQIRSDTGDRVVDLAQRAVTLTQLEGALFDEMVWASMNLVVDSLGLPMMLASASVGTDLDSQGEAAVELADLLAPAVDIPGFVDQIAAVRSGAVDLSSSLAGYDQLSVRLEAELEWTLDQLAGSSSDDNGRLVRAAGAMRSAVELRSAIADAFYGYFAAVYDIRNSPADEIGELVRSVSRFDRSLTELRSASDTFPEIAGGVRTIEADPGLRAFLAAIDDRVASALGDGVPETGAELSLAAVIRDVEGLSTVYGAAIDAAETTFEVIDAASTSTLQEAAEVRADADGEIRWAYTVAAVLTIATLLAAFLASRFIVRPLRDLRRAADDLHADDLRGEERSAPLEPSGPSEVRAATLALQSASENLDLLTRQARALARGDLDAEVLDEVAPGGLGGAVQHAVGTLRTALTQQDEFRRRLAHEASHDGLTKLANRNASMAQLTRSLARTERSGSQLAVLFIDLDRFKDVNDHHGHQAGDQVLLATAQRLVGTVREGDHVGRLGGDEFVVVAEPVEGIDDAVRLGERLVDVLTQPIDVGEARVTVGASIGVAVSATADLTADELLRDADLAVYRAKQLGRGGVHLCDEELREEMLQTADLAAAIRRAIDGEELLLHYQPIVDTQTQQLHAFEALVRWQRPGEDVLVPPDEFIPFAERSTLIVDLDRWVVEAVARQISAWNTAGLFPGVPVALNLSGRHLAHHDVVRHVLDPLERHAVDPSSVIVEITESALLDDLVNAAYQLEQMRTAGIRISIDDFGTGYTSLAHLRSLPIDILKIDRSFTMNAAKSDHEASIVKLIIDTGHLLGATITAEGIETLVEADELTRLGTDNLQGYYFARPQPPDRIAADVRLSTRSLPPDSASDAAPD